MAPPWRQHGARRKPPTLSLRERVAALAWLFAAEVGGRWNVETAQVLIALARARAQEVPVVLQGRAEAAWVRRWSGILACTAARAFTVSLLDSRPAVGTGEPVPSVQEVMREARFL